MTCDDPGSKKPPPGTGGASLGSGAQISLHRERYVNFPFERLE